METCKYRIPTPKGYLCTVELNGKDPNEIGCNKPCTNTKQILQQLCKTINKN